ncbi:MAG: glycosyltransferase [Microthrixaceae bacterium]|nr:glycosyltransferase [Microthrixaceae bacterium]
MPAVAMLSMHTSPLLQPGTGDAGGMNVFVRELAASLAQAGVSVRVYVRRDGPDQPDVVTVEPGFEVRHVTAGDQSLPKERLGDVVDRFADVVGADVAADGDVSAIHANYWLSGVAGHRLKHELGLPLVSTFHTLGRVKSATGDREPHRRAEAEAAVSGCSDLITAANSVEVTQLVDLYGANRERIELVAPGVDRAFFSPGDRAGARRALGLDGRPVVLFVGRLQPLKGATVAVEALAAMVRRDARLLLVGGPSGPGGPAELAALELAVERLGLSDRVVMVPPQPHHLLSTYYRAADACVVPSRSESFGLVALEAAACGIPVVASAVGGLTTLVRHGESGFLVKDRNPVEFAARLDSLLGNAGLAEAMGRAGMEVARRYAWSSTAGRLRRIYADLARRPALVECGA